MIPKAEVSPGTEGEVRGCPGTLDLGVPPTIINKAGVSQSCRNILLPRHMESVGEAGRVTLH